MKCHTVSQLVLKVTWPPQGGTKKKSFLSLHEALRRHLYVVVRIVVNFGVVVVFVVYLLMQPSLPFSGAAAPRLYTLRQSHSLPPPIIQNSFLLLFMFFFPFLSIFIRCFYNANGEIDGVCDEGGDYGGDEGKQQQNAHRQTDAFLRVSEDSVEGKWIGTIMRRQIRSIADNNRFYLETGHYASGCIRPEQTNIALAHNRNEIWDISLVKRARPSLNRDHRRGDDSSKFQGIVTMLFLCVWGEGHKGLSPSLLHPWQQDAIVTWIHSVERGQYQQTFKAAISCNIDNASRKKEKQTVNLNLDTSPFNWIRLGRISKQWSARCDNMVNRKKSFCATGLAANGRVNVSEPKCDHVSTMPFSRQVGYVLRRWCAICFAPNN